MPGYKRKYTRKASGLTTKQKSAVRKVVKKEIQKEAENKYMNTDQNLNVGSTSVLKSCLIMVPGLTDSTRVGDEIYLSKVMLDYTIEQPQPIAAGVPAFSDKEAHVLRFIVFQWFGNALPTAPDILQNVNVGDAINSDYFHDFKGLFKILYDKLHIVYPEKGLAAVHRKIIKGYRKKVMFTSGGNDAIENDLFTMVLSDFTGITNERQPKLLSTLHVEYTDM